MNEAQQKAYDQAKVMLAYARGECIEGMSKHVSGSKWTLLTAPPEWAWHNTDYRVAPKPLEFWVRASGPDLVSFYDSREADCKLAVGQFGGRAVLMREVV